MLKGRAAAPFAPPPPSYAPGERLGTLTVKVSENDTNNHYHYRK